MRRHAACGALLAAVIALAVTASVQAQGPTHGQMGGDKPSSMAAPPPIRTTMEALHASGGVPKGWKFLIPPGDPAKGRDVFVTMECFACHEVKGEDFPKASKRAHEPGPDLTGMGSHHPGEYFAESIVNPNRVIVQGQGYTGQDGMSKMPDYSDAMTVHQLVDVVAYLKSLTGSMTHDAGGGKPMDMKGHGMK